MKDIDRTRERLMKFLGKRQIEKHTNEILDIAQDISTNSNYAYYLPAVTYVLMKDKYGVAISASELKSEGLGQVKAKFIVRVRDRLGIKRNEPKVKDGQVVSAIERICRKLDMANQVRRFAMKLHENLSRRNVYNVHEFYCYSASLVYVSAKYNDALMTQESIIRQLNISPHFLRKYSRIITSEMGKFNL
ncbi:MAG: cyclin family protein [Candidatus Undinarchaeales archaeon]|jgi:transcription initiation factor TFIIIB Brf1 subunit/transcription initiation factor TFIIB|nr:cyclin family protein [Candidatus Undinarchaeales archaeon]MDP7491456.1 cyclin family protein [Candidatus Undinarchaeales archaeon]